MSTTDKTVKKRARKFLAENSDDWHRASDVANHIGSNTDYTRQQLNDLHKEGVADKKEDGVIVGTYINGRPVVVENKQQARDLIRTHADQVPARLNEMTLDELRAYIKANIGDWTGPISNKVWYRRKHN